MLEDTPVWQTYIADGVQKQWNYTLPYVEASKIKLYISHDGYFQEIDPTLYTFNRETNVLTYPIGDTPAAPAGDIIALWRETDLTQEEDSSHVAFKSNDVERMVDKLTAICQEIHDQQSRSISYNPAESSPSDITDATYYIHLLEHYEEGAEEAENNSKTWAQGTDQEVSELGGQKSSKGWSQESASHAASSSQYSNNSNIWAEGTDAQVSSLGGEKSAKGWADVAEGWIKVIFRDWTEG